MNTEWLHLLIRIMVKQKKRVWVNGTFDVLHIGHIKLLEYAASLGTVCVGIDTDDRVKQLKGENRPHNNVADRATMLLALRYVSKVKTFNSKEELIQLVKDWKPDYMVVGSDYADKRVIGSEYVKDLLYYPRILNHSTTKILNHNNND